MRHLGRSEVLRAAGIATLLTGSACYPRLSIWDRLEGHVFANLLVLMWCIFVLWAFVFAWHKEYFGQAPIRQDLPVRFWASIGAAGFGAAVLLRLALDPWLRGVAPWNYPESGMEWTAVVLFAVFFGALFLIFAPFAFYIRLTRNARVSSVATVLGATAVMLLRYLATADDRSVSTAALLAVVFAGQATVSLTLYLRGGALAVWLFMFLVETRHLVDYL
jgi:hypothetical protein